MMLKRILILFGLLLLGGMGASIPVVWAGVITVCPTGCDYDTIQGAVHAAAPGSTIQIASATYTETIIITKTLTLEGVGQAQPVVSGNDVGRPFTILGSVAVTITNMTVTRGRAPLEPDGSARGGGIFNQGHLTLDHVTITDNHVIAANGDATNGDGRSAAGGGIYAGCHNAICASLSLYHTIVTSNTIRGGDGLDGLAPSFAGYGGQAYGGGIYVACSGASSLYPCALDMTNSTLSYNIARGGDGGDKGLAYFPGGGGSASGGGLFYDCGGSSCQGVKVERSEVHHNVVQAGDGGDAPGPFGGSGPSDSYGGGLYLFGDFLIVGSRIFLNEAHSSEFYILIDPYAWKRSAGGGIFSRSADGFVLKSTVWQNEADLGGGISVSDHGLRLDSSTISQNIARQCGGGIYHRSESDLVMEFTTLVSNAALAYPSARGCGDQYEGGAGSGIYVSLYEVGVLDIKSSILAHNTEPNHVGGDCFGHVNSRGFNVIERIDRCTITGNTNGNIYDQNPLLGPLQDNGGLTPTHALLAGSVAIDAAAPADCPAMDQRNFARWVDGNGDGIARCDMGAYEYGGAPTDVGLLGTVRGRDVTPLPFAFLLLFLFFYALRTTYHALEKQRRLNVRLRMDGS